MSWVRNKIKNNILTIGLYTNVVLDQLETHHHTMKKGRSNFSWHVELLPDKDGGVFCGPQYEDEAVSVSAP